MFSNILLGVIAFNNWANNSIYKDDISDVYYSCNYMDWSTRVTYKLNGEEKSFVTWDFFEIQKIFKSDNDFKNFLLGLGYEDSYYIFESNIENFKNWVSKRDDREELVVSLLSKCYGRGWTVAHVLVFKNSDKFIELLGMLKEDNIMTMLEKKDYRGWTFAKALYEKEPEKFIEMINRKNFTDVQKQEINKLIGEDVFEVNAQNEENNEPVIDEIPAEKQSQSMFQRVVKFGIKIFEVTKSITGWLLYNLLGVRFWY